MRQLHHVLHGLPAVRSIMRISDSLSSFLMAPLRPAPLRGLQHGGTRLVQSVAAESLSLTASVLAYSQCFFERIDTLLDAVPARASSSYSPYLAYTQSAAHVSAKGLGAASEAAAYLKERIDS